MGIMMEMIIEEKLRQLIRDTLKVNAAGMTEEEKAYPLLSKRFQVMPYQMLVLFQRIEKEFGIKIEEQDIVNGKFNSYYDILEICCGSIKKRG